MNMPNDKHNNKPARDTLHSPHHAPFSPLAAIVVSLVIAQLIVVLGSWVWSAAMPESSVRSLLSSDGIRWLFGTFIANLSSSLLAWIMLLDIAAGMAVGSGMWRSLRMRLCPGKKGGKSLYPQQRSALGAALALLAIEIAVVLLLTMPRHAVLLRATGALFPSSFSVSIVPIVAFMVASASILYGLFSGSLHNYSDVVGCACHGGSRLKTLLIVYALAMELWCSVAYVLN